MAGNGPMMTYKDYEKVIEQPKGMTRQDIKTTPNAADFTL